MRVCKQIDYSAIFKIVLKMAEFPLTGYKLYCADVFARNTSLFCTIPEGSLDLLLSFPLSPFL